MPCRRLVFRQKIRAVLEDEDRLQVLFDLALIDSEDEPVFQAVTALASKIIGTPMSVMSMVGDEYQFFKSSYGIDDRRSTPLSHAFCKHVVAENAPLIVEDARVHPVLHDNGSVHDYGVVGYLGFPLHIASGKTLGSFCAVNTSPHTWSPDEINIMRELAAIVTYEIEIRALAAKGEITMEQLEQVHEDIIDFTKNVHTDLPKAKIADYIRTERQRLFTNI